MSSEELQPAARPFFQAAWWWPQGIKFWGPRFQPQERGLPSSWLSLAELPLVSWSHGELGTARALKRDLRSGRSVSPWPTGLGAEPAEDSPPPLPASPAAWNIGRDLLYNSVNAKNKRWDSSGKLLEHSCLERTRLVSAKHLASLVLDALMSLSHQPPCCIRMDAVCSIATSRAVPGCLRVWSVRDRSDARPGRWLLCKHFEDGRVEIHLFTLCLHDSRSCFIITIT